MSFQSFFDYPGQETDDASRQLVFLAHATPDDWAKLHRPHRGAALRRRRRRGPRGRAPRRSSTSSPAAASRCSVEGDKAGELRKIAAIEPGSVFGEQSFFDGKPRSANVRALSDGEIRSLTLPRVRGARGEGAGARAHGAASTSRGSSRSACGRRAGRVRRVWPNERGPRAVAALAESFRTTPSFRPVSPLRSPGTRCARSASPRRRRSRASSLVVRPEQGLFVAVAARHPDRAGCLPRRARAVAQRLPARRAQPAPAPRRLHEGARAHARHPRVQLRHRHRRVLRARRRRASSCSTPTARRPRS